MENKKWVGAFSISPTNLTLTNIQFKNETILVKVNPNISGNTLRIKFSNLYGDTSLNIKESWIYSTNTLSNNIHEKILFNNNAEVNIDKGKERYSDIINFNIEANQEFYIGFYLENFIELSTGNFSNLSYYISEKNNILNKFKTTKEKNIIEKTEYKNHIIPFITNVDVQNTNNCFSIVLFGDSNIGSNWSNYLNNKLKDHNLNYISVLVQEINGNRFINNSFDILKGLYGISGLARFQRDVLEQSGVKFLIMTIGFNDFILPYKNSKDNHKITEQEIIDGFKICIIRAKDKDIKTIGTTFPPFYGYKYYSDKLENIRNNINDWIRNSKEFDSIIDLDIFLRDKHDNKKLNKLYDSGNHFHLNEAGLKMILNNLDFNIFI